VISITTPFQQVLRNMVMGTCK